MYLPRRHLLQIIYLLCNRAHEVVYRSNKKYSKRQ